MQNLAENNLIRFINITRKKDGMFANFKAKGIRGGASFTASISVDIAALEVDIASDSFETIIEEAAKVAVKEFRQSEIEFEGLDAI